MIIVNEQETLFHVCTKETSLIFQVTTTKHLLMNYFGKRLPDINTEYIIKDIERVSYLSDTDLIKDFKLEQLPQVFPSYGITDLRKPAFEFMFEDGSRTSDLRYNGYDICVGKSKLDGLPQVEPNKDTDSIVFELIDDIKGIKVFITISAHYSENAFTQSVKVINCSEENVKINRLMSVNLDFLNNHFKLLTLSGAWGRENEIKINPIQQGFQGVESLRGASGHGQNPFGALLTPHTTETYGEVYALNFVYSGNFILNVEEDMHQNIRMQMGISPFDFEWTLEPEQVFQSPEVVMVYSDQGLGKMTRIFHALYRNNLLQGIWSRKERPILLNNWEATYFNFNQEKLLDLATKAKEIGIELFVLDDGWFAERENADSSLGDWYPNQKKLGGTLAELADKINQKELMFGLWFEPEMVSPNSKLYLEHPEWAIQCDGRLVQQSRQQYILDLANPQVCDYIVESISNVLRSANIQYVKWDMNRNFTNLGSTYLSPKKQKEQAHRYILGLYSILENILRQFPNVLFESCAGGGGRFDPGMLYYMPQTWTSDDTDAIERLRIQQGTSLVYPLISMGCHVSAVPNHQVGRDTPLRTRGIVAMEGNLGYELDLLQESSESLQNLKKQVHFYKKIRKTIQFGQFYRLTELDNKNQYAWQVVSNDQKEIVASYVQILAKCNTLSKRLKLSGLPHGEIYLEVESGQKYTSEELMYIGLSVPRIRQDYSAFQWYFVEE